MLRSNDSGYGTYSSKSNSNQGLASALEELVVMVIVMGLAAAIRFWKLGEWSFWADEVFSVQDAQMFPQQVTINPIMYMIVHFFTKTFGISEWSARLGPCIIGVLSVPLLYLVARRVFGSKVGVIACTFLVIHPWHIYWSQNARAYSLAFLFGALAAFTFYLALERDSIAHATLSVILTLLAIFSYPQSAVLIAALAGYVILLMLLPAGIPRGFNGRNLITYFAPFILALFILISPSVRSYLIAGWGINQWGIGPLYIIFTLVYSLGIPISVTAFLGGIHSLVYMNRGGLFLACYAVIPLIILLIISPFQNVHGYYLFFTMPAYLLLAAFCASELMDSASRKSRVMSVAVVLVIIVALLSQDYMYFKFENGGRPKWREAFRSVKHKIAKSDIVVTSTPRIADHYLWELTGKQQPEGTESSAAPNQVIQLKEVIRQLGSLEDQWSRKGQHIWFVLDNPNLKLADTDGRFREWVYSNCHLVETFPVHARTTDRTINVWSLKYPPKIGMPDAFDDFMF